MMPATTAATAAAAATSATSASATAAAASATSGSATTTEVAREVAPTAAAPVAYPAPTDLFDALTSAYGSQNFFRRRRHSRSAARSERQRANQRARREREIDSLNHFSPTFRRS
jgi:hypothetical protein